MMRTHVLTGSAPLQKVLAGAEKLYDAVSVTMGPRGRNVIFRKLGSQTGITHDGVTVARAVKLDDPAEDVAADLMREAGTKMEATTGDGTTTVTVLAYHMLKQAVRAVENGVNAMQVRRELEAMARDAVGRIEEHTIKDVGRKELIQVASVASNDPAIGYEVGSAIFEAGASTPVILGYSDSTETTVEVIKGISIASGTASPYIMEAGEVRHEIDYPSIIVVDSALRDKEDILPILRAVSGMNPEDKKFLLIATDIASDALSLLVVNKLKGFADVAVCRVPQSVHAPSQYLADLAVATGAKVLSRNTSWSIDDVTPEQFGKADKVTIDLQSTVIVSGHAIPEDLVAHSEALEKERESGKTAQARKFASDRLDTLHQRILSIHVGGQSATEAEERHYRFEDAIGAARSALRKGVLPGGGGLLFLVGAELGFEALQEPFMRVLENAGIDPEPYVEHLEYGLGVDVEAAEPQLVDMVAAGILDPAESEIEAVKTAASIAGLLLTSGALIVEEQVKDENPSQQIPSIG